MSRLSIELSPEQHQKIKALAALQGKSMKDFILSKLFPSNDDSTQAAWTELEQLLLARINQSETVNISPKSIQEITDDVLNKKES